MKVRSIKGSLICIVYDEGTQFTYLCQTNWNELTKVTNNFPRIMKMKILPIKKVGKKTHKENMPQ